MILNTASAFEVLIDPIWGKAGACEKLSSKGLLLVKNNQVVHIRSMVLMHIKVSICWSMKFAIANEHNLSVFKLYAFMLS